MNAVGKNLKQLRQREKLTQDALAERLHVTRQAVSSWETGKTQPDIETLTTLAEALNADVRELIYGPGREESYRRGQRKYAALAAICVAVLFIFCVLETVLRPFVQQICWETFVIYCFGHRFIFLANIPGFVDWIKNMNYYTLMRYSPWFLTGCLVFLGLNK